MLSFVDLDRSLRFVPGPVVMQLAQIDIGRGRQELFRNQLPALLTELANRARIASITASSALEGVVVSDQARAAAIIGGKVRSLRTRSEQELAGGDAQVQTRHREAQGLRLPILARALDRTLLEEEAGRNHEPTPRGQGQDLDGPGELAGRVPALGVKAPEREPRQVPDHDRQSGVVVALALFGIAQAGLLAEDFRHAVAAPLASTATP